MIIIYGATGVGKTALSYELAEYLNGAIINMDIGSLYSPLNIGTAKPDISKSTVPHYLFNMLESPVNYTVSDYRMQVASLIHEIDRNKMTPILVGGSGFYLNSLFFPPIAPAATSLPDDYRSRYQDLDNHALWQMLHAIDPSRAQSIHSNDRYRLERALAIWHLHKQQPSSLQPVYAPVTDNRVMILYCYRDREALYQNINERVRAMMNAGWMEEVISLLGTPWEPFLIEKKIIGYDDIIHCLRAERCDKEELSDTIARKSRNYAKRQLCYWRMLKKLLLSVPHAPIIHEIDCSGVDIISHIKHLIKSQYHH